MRINTGETVAVYNSVGFAVCKVGKIAFLEQGLGDEWRTMVLLSLITILEVKRREEENTSAVAAIRY